MKIYAVKSLNLLIASGFLLAVLGCQAISNLAGQVKSDNSKSISIKSSTAGTLADDIIGTWEGKARQDTVKMTFDKDGSFTLEEEESAPEKGTYSISGTDQIELKSPAHGSRTMKIKIDGDTMQMTGGPGALTINFKRIGSTNSPKNKPNTSSDSKSGLKISGLDGYWETDDKSFVIVFRDGMFQYNEKKPDAPKPLGTYKVINENTIEGQLPDKLPMTMTDINVSGDSLKMSVNGETIKAHRIA